MYYIEIPEKPACCEDCGLCYMKVYSPDHRCPALHKIVDPRSIDKNCPIKELKVPILVWEELPARGGYCSVYRAKITSFRCFPYNKVNDEEAYYYIYVDSKPRTIDLGRSYGVNHEKNYARCSFGLVSPQSCIGQTELTDTAQDALDKGKKLCQEHYDNIFKEMTGV